jgi:hypothetical protein
MLNVGGFFDPLLAWIDRAVAEGFLKPQHRAVLEVYRDSESLPWPATGPRPQRRSGSAATTGEQGFPLRVYPLGLTSHVRALGPAGLR